MNKTVVMINWLSLGFQSFILWKKYALPRSEWFNTSWWSKVEMFAAWYWSYCLRLSLRWPLWVCGQIHGQDDALSRCLSAVFKHWVLSSNPLVRDIASVVREPCLKNAATMNNYSHMDKYCIKSLIWFHLHILKTQLLWAIFDIFFHQFQVHTVILLLCIHP